MSAGAFGARPETLVDRLVACAVSSPELALFTFADGDNGDADQVLTARALDRCARSLAARLQARLAPGDRVLLTAPPGREFVVGFFGCLYAGLTVAPTFPPDPSRLQRTLPRFRSILAHAGPAAVLSTALGCAASTALAEYAPEALNVPWFAIDDENAGREADWVRADVALESIAMLQYTSGSTSAPRAVALSHANLWHNAAATAEAFGLGPESRSVFWVPPYHDMGLIGGIVQTAYGGYPALLMSPLTFLQRPLRWLLAVTRFRATVSGGPNFAFDLCVRKSTPAERELLDVSTWRVAFCGAEPVRAETIERFVETFAPCGFRREAFVPCYGLAESTLMVSTSSQVEGPVTRVARTDALERGRVEVVAPAEASSARTNVLVSVGAPTRGLDVAIVDPLARTRCAPGQVGEVWVAGGSVAQGYWNDEAQTAATFGAALVGEGEARYLRTGDLAVIVDGRLFITGRAKDLIIVDGRNVYPQDIEHTAERAHTAVRPGCSVAFSVPGASGERVVVVCELERREAAARGVVEHVLAAIRRAITLQHDVVPAALFLVKAGTIPKTSSGKVQRRATREAFLTNALELIASWSSDGPGRDARAPVAAASREARAEFERWLAERLGQLAGVEAAAIDLTRPFVDHGIGSAQAIGLSGEIAERVGRALPPTLLWDHPSPAELARHLCSEPAASPRDDVSPRALGTTRDAIAIVGVGCRFPGGDGPEAFWSLLREGTDAVTEVPAERWDAEAHVDPDPDAPGKTTSRWGAFLADAFGFDATFFGITGAEAAEMDVQQRLVLEVAWHALEHAGIAPDALRDTAGGVFLGLSSAARDAPSATSSSRFTATGAMASVAAGRLAYVLGLRGPALALDTSCSSSLVAVHLACQSLRAGECDLALAGGVNAPLTLEASVALAKLRALSPTGRCRAFDAAADGYVRGEGCGIVVLKRLSDALADGDRVIAVVRGSAVNSDGHSNGLTAPSGAAQRAVIRRALEDAALAPDAVGYVEAHGTGTPLGDPIEMRAVAAAITADRAADAPPLMVGSAKTNIGHLEAAAGVVGLIKAALVLEHGEIPPHLHLRAPSPHIPWRELRVAVPTTRTPWTARAGSPRVAGVSAFGLSGTNAHVVLSEAPSRARAAPRGDGEAHMLCLSARTEPALRASAAQLAAHLAVATDALVDVCHTANVGRAHHGERLAIVARSTAEARARLEDFTQSRATQGIHRGTARAPVRVAFVFSGQGDGDPREGHTLLASEPAFREAYMRCDALVRSALGQPLPLTAPDADPRAPLDPVLAQPTMFALQYALACLWRAWGVEPHAVLGHSLGELAAACVADALSLEDAVSLVVSRARLMDGLGPGAMASVHADEARVTEALAAHDGRVVVAAINAPAQVVVSGDVDAVDALLATLEATGIDARRLAVSRAFHSPHVEPALDAIERAARACDARPARVPMVLAADARSLAVGEALDASYWRRQAREAVRFADGVAALLALDCEAFVEIGPTTQLAALARRCAPNALCAPSLRPGRDARATLLATLAALHVRGTRVDFHVLAQGRTPARVALPGYPFARPAAAPHARHTRGVAMGVSQTQEILGALQGMVGEVLQMPTEQVGVNTALLEMGADSIALAQAIRAIERRFGVRVPLRRLFEDLTTLEALAAHLASAMPSPRAPAPVLATTASPLASPPAPLPQPPAVAPAPARAPSPSPAAPAAWTATGAPSYSASDAHTPPPLPQPVTTVERVVAQQLDAFTRLARQQIEAIAGHGPRIEAAPSLTPARLPMPAPAPQATLAPIIATNGLNAQQRAHLDALAERYTRRTLRSREYAATHRPRYADLRSSYGFRPSIKDMVYPLVRGRARGARLWDIDGNEYVDFTMGFGVYLFGHGFDVVDEAVRRQLAVGFELGPRSEHAGAVAELVAEMTGMDRVAFCATGSEANTLALRLARAATGRELVAIFAGAYHGNADGLQAQADEFDGERTTVPLTPGVTRGAVRDVIVLEYGSDEALATLRERAHELAAVLVEPVRSRFPSLQPAAFLREVREITARSNAALVFDEVITGFRIAPGGAQEYFGVRADLATYGKVLGGGLPIGVVAGRRDLLDRLDGGAWRFGDDSRPSPHTTLFGSTFATHPLSMAVARAVLEHLRAAGPGLQRELNARTERLAGELDALFAREGAPMRVAHFASLFRFEYSGNRDPFFFHLVEHGVYTWEQRGCFLSTAHTDEDLAQIVRAVKASVHAMQAGGFLPAPRAPDPAPAPAPREPSPDAASTPWRPRKIWSPAPSGPAVPGASARGVSASRFSLYFFGNYEPEFHAEKYKLLIASARFADAHGFDAVWLPERHFHAFGGLSPNPSVLAAALARETTRVHLRAGSVVAPLHHPVRVAEEWSVVDNLSQGRVGVAFAAGWHANDFVLAPEAFAERRAVTLRRVNEIGALWRGEALALPGPDGGAVSVKLVPRPMQPELPVWLTVVNNPETYEAAGRAGVHVLTSLMGQTPDELAVNIERYRAARAANGHDPAAGRVTLLVHAHVGRDIAETRARARAPFLAYLRASVGLFNAIGRSRGAEGAADSLSPEDVDYLLSAAYERYCQEAALIGSVESCRPIVERLVGLGVDELSCLVDFGLPGDQVLEGLSHLDALREACVVNGARDALRVSGGEPVVPPTGQPTDAPALSTGARLESRPLAELFARGDLAPVDAAAIGYVPAEVLDLLGLTREQLLGDVFARRPFVNAVYDTHLGRIASVVVPRLSSELYDDQAALLEEVDEVLAVSRSIGARTASLVGLLPSATDYGHAIEKRRGGAGADRLRITTGHATTAAAVALSVAGALATAGRDLQGECLAVLGLGSIGGSSLRLVLERLQHPREIVLCDLASREAALEAMRDEITRRLGFRGRVTLARSRGAAPAEVYAATTIIGATSVSGVLDVARLRPGTVVVDDSSPHCFDQSAALRRVSERADLLVTEGGKLRADRPIASVQYLPSAFAADTLFAEWLLAGDPHEIMGCTLSSLLTASFEHVVPTIGLAEPAACNAHYDALRALHFNAAGLQCEGIPLPAGAIERFRAAFGASPQRASVRPSQVDPS
uniref:Amino acid adenylation domain protein n=1 Tax=Chondromyces catenulatus TaxID=1653841 RepID=A0A3S5GY16_9BACT|nr:amino acid adenylation domain protein [Chondromyces catenulatus]